MVAASDWVVLPKVVDHGITCVGQSEAFVIEDISAFLNLHEGVLLGQGSNSILVYQFPSEFRWCQGFAMWANSTSEIADLE